MLVLALTGGIATGKSTAVRLFQEFVPDIVIFDCDASVKLLLEDARVVSELKNLFGEHITDPETGTLIREKLRAEVFGNPEKRKQLEGVLHPRVREECLALKEKAAKEGARCFLADVPLLFENGFDFGHERSITVSTTRATQIARLRERDGWDEELIASVLDAQLPLEEKAKLADIVFWNEGHHEALEAQVHRFCQIFPPLSMPDKKDTETPETTEETSANTAVAEAPEQETSRPEKKEPEPFPVPEHIDLNAFRLKPLSELQKIAAELPARIQGGITKAQLVYEIICFYVANGTDVTCVGVIEFGKEHFAMIRDAQRSFRPSQDDIHIGGPVLNDANLRNGQLLKVKVRKPVQRDKYLTTEAILEIEGKPAEDWQEPVEFEKLTPMFPDSRVHLEGEGTEFLGVRVIDLIAPLGKGQRGLIVAPPRGGKTILLKQIAKSIKANNPEIELVILLLDERPEEVTDFEETVEAPVFASTFDETPKRHAQVADLVIARAQRMVEQGKHVVLLLDSLTRLARGHNSAMQGGPIGSGGVSPAALAKSRKFFGTARNIENGGSLTILATALIETESRLDDVVFEEFKGTGNMEVRLDRELAERRVYPAIHIPESGTRNDDRLYHPAEFLKVIEVRKQLAALPIGDALVTLLNNLKPTKTNAEFLLRGLR
ncbi:MAG: transcription termination factor Rho [Akkermansiaceae bacterium]|jgi:transcription termination factor Rho|nr:transcription termination factor Rho [Akkermansiaceae bacterium]MDP4645791.1 transcription termination factor Rho [Akkermansiaceae bacterium]MDP4720094.1 transcription termination factor Rho [Akkermansiaceae bacterium]MDP4779036.1 transcription termination factor Rho [Akkermansiaceae bacterium]MDP4847960.1 transcription termination factor Rho [Akkermansiaceae bacterium]